MIAERVNRMTVRGRRASFVGFGFGLSAGVFALSIVIAAAVLGLLLADPVGVADAVSSGDLTAMFHVVSSYVMSVVREAIRYL